LLLSSLTLIGFSFELYPLAIAPVGILILLLLLFNLKVGYYFTAFMLPFSIKVTLPQISLNTPSEILIAILFIGTIFEISKGFNKQLFTHPISLIIALLSLLFLISGLASDIPFASLKVFVKFFILSTTCYYGILHIALGDTFFPVKVLTTHVFAFVAIALKNIGEHSMHNFQRSYAWYIATPFYSDHAIYATTAAFVICMLFVLVLWNFKKVNLRFLILLTSLFVCLFAIYLTYSRAAWLSVLIAFCFYFLIKLRITWFQIAFVLGFGIIVLFSISDNLFMSLRRNDADSKKENTNIEEQFKSMSNVNNDVSNLERLNRWNAALRMIEERPFTGFGIGTYQFKYFPYQKPNEMTYISIRNPQSKYLAGVGGTTHSEYLLISSESGILSGIAYLSLLIIAIAIVLKRTYNMVTSYNYYILIGLGMSIVTYLIHGGFNNYLDTDKISFLFYATLAAIASIDIYLKNNVQITS
jgi:putative inorganic carbon (hco3(-)) transporter